MQVGVKAFTDPSNIIEEIQRQITGHGFRFTHRSCEVKTSDWLEYDDTEENVIGCTGTEYNLDLIVTLENSDKKTN